MSLYLLFYGILLFFYDLLALLGYSSLIGIKHFRHAQQRLGSWQAHWLLRLVALSLISAGLSVQYGRA
jgi:uncharacterized membrane protein